MAQTIAAHGGAQLWEGAGEVRVEVSSGGLAFASKLQGRAVRGVDARVSTRGQHVTLSPYPGPGERGVLREDGSVRIETDAGEMIRVRENAREACAHLRHKLWWDRLDILYFATQALWTYVSTPFVFERDGYGVRELEPWNEDGELFRRLAVTFPPTRPHALPRAGLLHRRERPDPPTRLHRRADQQACEGCALLHGSSVLRRTDDRDAQARIPAQGE